MARMFFGWPRGGGDGWGGTRESKAGGKVSVSGAVPGFASLGVQIFGNGRVGSGRDDGLALGLAWAQLAGTGSRWGSKKIFRYLYVGRLWGLQIGIEPMADTVRLHGRYNGGRVMTKKKKKKEMLRR